MVSKFKRPNKALISSIAKKIAKELNPDKILLFGSATSYDLSNCNDIDLFIVMDSDLRRDQRSVQISKLFPDRLFALDSIVYTPEEVKISLKTEDPFIKEIFTKGKILYES